MTLNILKLKPAQMIKNDEWSLRKHGFEPDTSFIVGVVSAQKPQKEKQPMTAVIIQKGVQKTTQNQLPADSIKQLMLV